MDKNQAFVDLLKRVANNQGATPAQIALAWLLASPSGPSLYRSPVRPSCTGSKRILAPRMCS
jgi:aryl-alcohol dehydrogenase-like predicted oxidoreductase